jgi:autotransporter translocation and assembly factor TamB
MKKIVPAFLLLCLILFTSGFSLKEWRTSLYDSVKSQAESNFSALFNRHVSIASAGGLIVGRIELNNMTIPGLGRAEKVVLTYNPITYAFAKGDMVPALTKITVINGSFKIERDKNGVFTILSSFSGSGASAGPPPFHGRVIIQNCSAEYIDQRGFKETPGYFSVKAQKVNGWLDLGKKDALNFSVSGRVPEFVKAQGSFDLTTKKYELNVAAEKLDLKKWANYTIPLPGFQAQGGKADLNLRVAPAKTKGWAAALTGKVSFYGAAADFQSYLLSAVSGDLFLDDEKLAVKNLTVKINGLLLAVNGRFYDFSQRNLDLSIFATAPELTSLTSFWPQLKSLDPAGHGTAKIRLAGSVANPIISGEATIAQGQIYGQAVSGTVKFSLKNKTLSANSNNLKFFNGQLNARLDLELSNNPSLNLNCKISGLDLAALAQRSPGIEGKADGTFELGGPLNDLKGKLSAQLSRGLVFGQPMHRVSSSFKIVNNNFLLDEFTAASGDVNFRADGTVTHDLVFDLRAEAAGFHLKGKGVFGEMSATLNSFKGRTRWKLDKEFLAQPLSNLTASGEVTLTGGRIGDQLFDEARGGISLGNGRIAINEAQIKKEQSVVRLSGVTGLGTPTKLFVAGNNVDLADLKLNSTGSASFEIEVTGELSKETRIVSLDTLLGLTANGRLQILKAEIAGTAVTEAFLKFNWQDRSLKLEGSRVVTPFSRFNLDLTYKKDGSLEGSLKGAADLNYYHNLTSQFGKISGLVGLALNLGGSVAKPQLSASFRLNNFGFNNIYFDDVSGSLGYSANKLTVLKPISFKNGSDLYSLSGDLVWDPVSPEASSLGLSFQVLKADLASSYRLLYNIQGEISRRFFVARQVQPVTSINPAAFKLPDLSAFSRDGRLQLYLSEGPKPYYLSAWKKVWQQSEKTQAAAPEETMGGCLTAEVTLSGKVADLDGRLLGQISRGFFREFHFDLFEAEASLKGQGIKIGKAVLSKSGGHVSALGTYNLNGALAVKVSADKMPLDILQIVFPGKRFKGVFDLNAILGGSLKNLTASLEARGKNLSLASIDLDEAALSLAKNNDYLYLNKFSLRQGESASSASGFLSLTHPGSVSLEAELKGNTVGLMNLFTDQVKWNSGSADLYARVSGTLNRPKISGRASVKDGSVRIAALESDVKDLQGWASIESNVLTINALTGTWTGKRTKDVSDPVGLAGTIDLSRVLAEKSSLDLNLAFSPTLVYANFPNLYIGTLKVKELSLQGPLYLDGSDGPTLAGRVEVNNSVITLSQPSGGQALPLHLDLNIDLAKNSYVAMGDVATLNLSNILMNLEVTGALQVSGLLRDPDLLGKIVIRRGTVNIFNREFSLLTAEMQKKYSTYSSQIAQENFASFKGDGAQPDLEITASVDVQNQEKDPAGNPVKKKVNVLAHLSGTPGAKEEAQALKISLASYTEDTTKAPSEFVPAAYSEQDLKVMLLPDFIKSLAGIGQTQGAGENNVDSNAVVADYLNSRVQSILFRSLEREAEQTLGLESLTLEYNFGPKIGEALGVRDIKGFEQQKPAWSVGFVKGFFDRLYIDVRYAQGTDQPSPTTYGQTLFNYQLTYKLTPIWSIIYYREPNSLSNPATGYQKMTLKAGFSLW